MDLTTMYPTASESVQPQPSLPRRETKRLVAIGHNIDNVDLLEETTRSLGYLFDAATSTEAIDAVFDDPQSVSLAVVDVRSVTSRVQHLCRRLHDRDVPVLLLTSHLSTSFENRLQRTPGLTVRRKPAGRTALTQEIRSLTGQ